MLPISFSFASEQLKYLVPMEIFPGFFSNSERVVDRLPLMTSIIGKVQIFEIATAFAW